MTKRKTDMEIIEYKNIKPNGEKFICFGFSYENGVYFRSFEIAAGQLELKVELAPDKTLKACVYDTSFGEEYVLHKVKDASGAFVGAVKKQYEEIIASVLENCFDSDIYKTDQASLLQKYVFEKYASIPEFPWNDENSIVRREDNKKWYAAFLVIPSKRLGFDNDKKVEVVNIKAPPCEIERIVDNKSIFPAYHMNKKHWITVLFDSGLDFEEICQRVDESYRLVGK